LNDDKIHRMLEINSVLNDSLLIAFSFYDDQTNCLHQLLVCETGITFLIHLTQIF